MPVSASYRAYVLEQLTVIGPVSARAMFGGLGLYHEGYFFGLVDDDTLYLKVDDDTLYLKVDDGTRPDYERAGMGPFRPSGDEGPSMGYYEVPVEILEDRARLGEWAGRAVEVARRSPAARRTRRNLRT